jgi:hypothetical protein
LRERRLALAADYDLLHQSRRPVIDARDSVDAEIERLLAERKRLRIDRPKWLDVTLAARLDKLRAVATATEVNRQELHTIFRALFVKVVVDWENERLVFHWQHGGESWVRANMKPQRQVANVRRADRPRFQPGQLAQPLPVAAR